MPTLDEITDFSKKIESFAKENKLSLMDSIVSYCEKNEFEVEVAATLISQKLKQKIYIEAQNLNLVPKGNKLPL